MRLRRTIVVSLLLSLVCTGCFGRFASHQSSSLSNGAGSG